MIAEIEVREPVSAPGSPRVKMRILEQMAEALEDQVAGLYRRAAAFEEEEFLLNREVEDRQTEINRLSLKLDSMRSERDRVMEKIESISREAAAMRDALVDDEENNALAGIEEGGLEVDDETSRSAMYFRRLTLAEQASQA
jgi:chromosome segregation ATPase